MQRPSTSRGHFGLRWKPSSLRTWSFNLSLSFSWCRACRAHAPLTVCSTVVPHSTTACPSFLPWPATARPRAQRLATLLRGAGLERCWWCQPGRLGDIGESGPREAAPSPATSRRVCVRTRTASSVPCSLLQEAHERGGSESPSLRREHHRARHVYMTCIQLASSK